MNFPCDFEGCGLWDEDGRRFFERKQVIFQNVDEYDHQVNGDICVIIIFANAPDERYHQQYIAFWL